MEVVTLGRHEVEVYAQRHAYITNKVGKILGKVIEGGVDIQDPAGIYAYFLGDGAYPLLAGMVPNYGKRCPQYEFMGYGSQAALDAGEYDEAEDNSPTYEQMVTAFEVIARINRFDVLKVLKGVVDPNLLKAQFSVLVSDAMEDWTSTRTLSGASATEPVPSGGSQTSTPSGTTPPTSTGTGDSPTSDWIDLEGHPTPVT